MGLFTKGRKRNWDQIKDQSYKETMKGRDVYEDQQLERGKIQPMTTMLGRNILNGVICLLVFMVVWMLVSCLDWAFSGGGKLELSGNPEANWFAVQEHYVDPENPEDRLMVSEYQALVEVYKGHGDIPVVPDPGPEPVKADVESGWRWKLSHYENEDGETMSGADYKAMVEANDAAFEAEHEAWTEAQSAYDGYVASQTDPASKYMKQKAHYRNRSDPEEYILPEEYSKLVDKYESRKAAGRLSEDALDVPVLPMDPKDLYVPSEYAENDDGKDVVSAYRNKYDGTRLTAEEYEAARADYKTAVAEYKTAYMRHRAEFHPDDPEGTKKVFSMGPTLVKFAASALVAGIVFSVLYMILKKNLAAQNIMSTTSDINQYHNDQHVALIEEVQRNYDWFPDVGAHSSVSVSSLISHMALSNKGLKTVTMAERAQEDIKDGDDVEYFKGEILLDGQGKPITRTLPMIDEEFMEDLFKTSGAADDKTIRRRFDTTQIPYNPDGKNRDKLGKFATVAELINADWEIPIYEPQRPAGAYIVDTAPVNTMI